MPRLTRLGSVLVLALVLSACGNSSQVITVPTARPTPVPTATPMPTPVVTPAPVVTPTPEVTLTPGLKWKEYSRDDVVAAFTANQGLIFGDEQADDTGAYVVALDEATHIGVAIFGKSGTAPVTKIIVTDMAAGAGTSQQMMDFAVGLMEPNGADAANAWVAGELERAAASGETFTDEDAFIATHLIFNGWPANQPLGLSLAIEPAN